LLVGLAAILCTILIHAAAGRGLVRLVFGATRRGLVGVGFRGDVIVISGAALILIFAHLIEIALWGALLMACGEFQRFGPAIYHSAMNYTTLGYGDIVMSPKWRFLGPIEAVNGMLLVGVSTAVLFSIIQRITRKTIPGIWSDEIGS
jgi:hypothetical protein